MKIKDFIKKDIGQQDGEGEDEKEEDENEEDNSNEESDKEKHDDDEEKKSEEDDKEENSEEEDEEPRKQAPIDASLTKIGVILTDIITNYNIVDIKHIINMFLKSKDISFLSFYNKFLFDAERFRYHYVLRNFLTSISSKTETEMVKDIKYYIKYKADTIIFDMFNTNNEIQLETIKKKFEEENVFYDKNYVVYFLKYLKKLKNTKNTRGKKEYKKDFSMYSVILNDVLNTLPPNLLSQFIKHFVDNDFGLTFEESYQNFASNKEISKIIDDFGKALKIYTCPMSEKNINKFEVKNCEFTTSKYSELVEHIKTHKEKKEQNEKEDIEVQIYNKLNIKQEYKRLYSIRPWIKSFIKKIYISRDPTYNYIYHSF